MCRTDEGYFWHGQQLAKGAGVLLAEAPINEGDSGGPVVDDRGEVVGVMSAVRWQARLASLCIAADEVRAFLDPKSPAMPEKPAEATGGAAIYRKALPSVALVKTTSANDRATAWVLDRRHGLLITSAARSDRKILSMSCFRSTRMAGLWPNPTTTATIAPSCAPAAIPSAAGC